MDTRTEMNNKANQKGNQVASKAGAYGGSEVGSLVGKAVGPPIIGGIVGNIVGEKFGEKTITGSGLDTMAGHVHDDLTRVFGKERADKVGDIALTALGYSESEYCICCPCMPASQIQFFLMILFFIFNCFRLSIGIQFDSNCTNVLNSSQILNLTDSEFQDSNQTVEYISVINSDNQTDTVTLLVSFPCHFGFHYILSGAAVWIAFLPFHLFTLLGNCWRQCCCCLCDPVVCCSTVVDLVKRCLCECGKFSCLDFIWYSMCIFQVIWACFGINWITETYMDETQDFKNFDHDYILIPTVISAIVLDIIFAGSELVHRIRLSFVYKEEEPENFQMVPQQV